MKWIKNYKEKYLIKIYLDILKDNKIAIYNLQKILREIGYIKENDKNNINKVYDIKPKNNNYIENLDNLDKEHIINKDIEIIENENNIERNKTISMENILKIRINNNEIDNINFKQKIEDDLESSCNGEYYESTNILLLDEYENIQMNENISKDNDNDNNYNENYNILFNDIIQKRFIYFFFY